MIFWGYKLIIFLAKFRDRSGPTSVTVVNFSGIKSQGDNYYQPGTGGVIPGTNGMFVHYRVEIDPVNVSEHSDSGYAFFRVEN